MQPSTKSPAIESFLEKLSGRTTAISGDVCVSPPFGCGQLATEFRDEISKKEFSISGLCQKCQDKVFGTS